MTMLSFAARAVAHFVRRHARATGRFNSNPIAALPRDLGLNLGVGSQTAPFCSLDGLEKQFSQKLKAELAGESMCVHTRNDGVIRRGPGRAIDCFG